MPQHASYCGLLLAVLSFHKLSLMVYSVTTNKYRFSRDVIFVSWYYYVFECFVRAIEPNMCLYLCRVAPSNHRKNSQNVNSYKLWLWVNTICSILHRYLFVTVCDSLWVCSFLEDTVANLFINKDPVNK